MKHTARHAKRNPFLRTTCLAVSVGLLAMGSIQAASAYWSGSGSGSETGSGSATTETTVAVTLAPGSPTDALYPGGRTDVVLVVSNPNDSLVHIDALALDPARGSGGFAVDIAHSSCSLSALSFITQSNDGAGWDVPAKAAETDGELPVTLTNALSMGIGAAMACEGASFTVYLSVDS